jgi:hypothetical protein
MAGFGVSKMLMLKEKEIAPRGEVLDVFTHNARDD